MIQETVRDRMSALRGHGAADVLAALGLERRRQPVEVIIPAAGVFFAGMLFGAGLAFLVAPKPGRETRRQLRDKASDLTHRLAKPGQLAHDARERLFGHRENGGSNRRSTESHRIPPPPPHLPGTQK